MQFTSFWTQPGTGKPGKCCRAGPAGGLTQTQQSLMGPESRGTSAAAGKYSVTGEVGCEPGIHPLKITLP